MSGTNIRAKELAIVGTVQGGIDRPAGFVNQLQRRIIMWTKPEVTEMRFGFEVTMYVCNR